MYPGPVIHSHFDQCFCILTRQQKTPGAAAPDLLRKRAPHASLEGRRADRTINGSTRDADRCERSRRSWCDRPIKCGMIKRCFGLKRWSGRSRLLLRERVTLACFMKLARHVSQEGVWIRLAVKVIHSIIYRNLSINGFAAAPAGSI